MYIYVVLNVNSLFHKIKQTSEIDIVRQSKPIEFFLKKIMMAYYGLDL